MYFTGTSRCLYLTLFSIHCEYDFNISYVIQNWIFFLTKCVLEVQFVQIVFVHNLSIKILLSMIQIQYFSWRRRIHTLHQWYWPEDKQLFTLYSVENIRYECFLCKLFGDCFRKWKQTDRHSHCIIEIYFWWNYIGSYIRSSCGMQRKFNPFETKLKSRHLKGNHLCFS